MPSPASTVRILSQPGPAEPGHYGPAVPTKQPATPELWLRSEANWTSKAALAISIFSAAIALVAFLYPIHSSHTRNADHEEALVAGLAATNRQQFLTAMSHVQQDSAAETYLKNIDDWWDAALAESGKKTWSDLTPADAGYSAEGDGFRVCLPDLVDTPGRCATYSDFVHNSQTGLISRFSIDQIPVDVLSSRTDSDLDRLGDEGGLKVYARRYGRVTSPDQSTVCMSYYLSVDSDEKRPSIHFTRKAFTFQDQNEKSSEGKVYWPAKLNYLGRSYAVACLPSPGGYGSR